MAVAGSGVETAADNKRRVEPLGKWPVARGRVAPELRGAVFCSKPQTDEVSLPHPSLVFKVMTLSKEECASRQPLSRITV